MMQYTKEELVTLTKRMREVANAVYPMLASCEVHPWVEFNGLMQKYVDVCEKAAAQGVDFPMATDHAGIALPVEVHDLLYLAEKLRCIFGPILDSNPEARRVFFDALAGGRHALPPMTSKDGMVTMPVARLREFVVACARALLRGADDWSAAEIVAELGEAGEWRMWMNALVDKSVEACVEHGHMERDVS